MQSASVFEPPAGLGALLGWRRNWLSIDTNPRALTLAQSRRGKLVIYAGFVVMLALAHQVSLTATALIAATIAACMLAPHRKLIVISISGIVYFCLRPYRTQQQIEFSERLYPAELVIAELPALAPYTPLAAVFLALCYGAVHIAHRCPTAPLVRRPLLGQLLVMASLVALASFIPEQTTLHGLLWCAIVMMAASFFFLAYAIADTRSRNGIPPSLQVGFLRPFWSGPSIPFKGPSYLRKFEAFQPAELAALRLRALKLIVWAAVLAGICRLMEAAAYGLADLPTLQQAIAETAQGSARGLAASWSVLIIAFLLNVISLGALVHTLVAVIRMCGYGIPRGMARPLSARSIAEFWNRYLFYFKELLVDFFFYPAFVRFFKRQPRLRIAFATFSAAFVGNMLFSIVSQAHLFAELGIWPALARFDSYAVYAMALSIALIASQLAPRKPRPQDGFLRYQVAPRFWVIGFFCIAQIFSDESGQTSLAERTGFLLHLVGA